MADDAVYRGAEEVAMKSSSMKKSTSLPADLDNAALKVTKELKY